MESKPLHIVWTLANNSTAPYFTWFAERAQREKDIRFSFVVLYPSTPLMIEEMEKLGSKAYWIPFNHESRISSMLKSVAPLVKLFRKLMPDVVHTHLFDDALPVLIAARIVGIPVRVITKGDAAFHWQFARKGIKYDRLNNRNATHIVAISEENKEFILQNENADSTKMNLIHHGVPVGEITNSSEEERSLLRKRFGIANEDIMIGTVSRLIEWKGYRHIIDAAEILVKENPQLKFLFTGSGGQETQLKKIIADKNLQNNIFFTGWIKREEMPALYGIMDIYVHAALLEPFGFVIAEAMLNGVPVVSTRTGSARDAIRTEENGYLVTGQNADSIVAGIEFMLTHDRKKIGENGRKTAMEMFSFEKMWSKHISIYREACRRKD